MAKLTHEDVLKLARLAKLHLTEAEAKRFQNEISAILGYVEQLQAVDLDDYKPTSQVTGLTNVMRADKVKDYGTRTADLLKNAPATQDGQIKVRRMIQ